MPFEAGDLLLFYGRDIASRAIEWATRGPSHVGIICPHRPGAGSAERRETRAPGPGVGAAPNLLEREIESDTTDAATPLLFESTTLCEEPCVLAGRPVEGVQAHDPAGRITRYGGAVARMRLTPAWRLNAPEVELLHDWLLNVAHEPYDLCGALVSGTRLFKWSALMPYPDLASLFCSELCAAVLMRLHRMPLENPGVYNPASLVRVLRRCGTYGAPRVIKKAGRNPSPCSLTI